MRTAPLLVLMTLCCSTAAIADETCQGLLTKLTSEVDAADQVSAAQKTVKCRAYEKVAMDLGETAKACGGSQQDVDLAKSKFRPLAQRVADGETQSCGK